MSYFPNVRNPYQESLSGESTPEPNPYWEEILPEEQQGRLVAYDACMDEVNNFFANLDCFGTDFAEVGFAVDNVDDVVMRGYAYLDDYSREERRGMTEETKLMLILREALKDWLEMARTENVVSMIDAMNDKEYDARWKAAWGDTPE